MAINKNHEFEDLDGVKCAIVEKNASKERVAFLKDLLEFNRYKVIVVPSPPPKSAPAPKPVEGEAPVEAAPAPPPPETFTVGVTDVTFNATNAIFGRLLKTKDNRVVTLAYWQQEEATSSDNIPYFSLDENSHQWK
ncbi:hypothetical protein [Lacibacter sp. H407]|uniref:hypothetical protein n=1 Tax=Lacibacter sp. H407 TaxID=3133423 RepID=UPI0030BD7B88